MTLEENLDQSRAAAMEIYNNSMCAGAGCCGDIDSALDAERRGLVQAILAEKDPLAALRRMA